MISRKEFSYNQGLRYSGVWRFWGVCKWGYKVLLVLGLVAFFMNPGTGRQGVDDESG